MFASSPKPTPILTGHDQQVAGPVTGQQPGFWQRLGNVLKKGGGLAWRLLKNLPEIVKTVKDVHKSGSELKDMYDVVKGKTA